ncbi:RHS repeat-associated core domain-containing protein [Microvirgula aerodenitrificans]|uniref:RHS repeat-associated core domain-containing protein n=1 Tax=Microvirgula aerodenitrificans TaxID=57480 RepID=UPI00248DBAEB|nr:RHS repeat-associated core domain-containing protein [Microvirgula aerodenitrificans]
MSSGKSPTTEQAAATMARPQVGMHGERIDWITPRSQLYHLGDGARSYDPMLQCFLGKDPYSPFSVGGINPYVFCGGDPVNRTDHSGYMSVSAGFGLGLGILGIILGVLTFGLATLVAMTAVGALLLATSTVLGLASSAIGITAAVKEESDPELARILGQVSLGLGIASAVTGLVGPAMASCAKATGRLVVGRLAGENHSRYLPARPATRRLPAREEINFVFRSKFRDGALVMTHSEPGVMQTVDGLYLPPGEWTDALFHLPAYQAAPREAPLYLMACGSTRNGSSSNAAAVANSLGRDVYAFNSPDNLSTLIPSAHARIYAGHGSTWGKLLRFSPM